MQIVHEVVNGEDYENAPLGVYIVQALGICGGRPTFKYTRIEVAGALDRLRAGESLDSVVAGYGGRVPREAIQEAVDVALRHFFENLPDLTTA